MKGARLLSIGMSFRRWETTITEAPQTAATRTSPPASSWAWRQARKRFTTNQRVGYHSRVAVHEDRGLKGGKAHAEKLSA